MAYSFASASTQYLSGSSPVGGTLPITIACWARPTAVAVTQGLIELKNVGRTQFFLMYFGNDAAPNEPLFVYQSGATTGSQGSKTRYAANTWNHCASLYSSTTSRTSLLDGASGTTNTTNTGASSVADMIIASNGSISALLNGRMAEVAIWSANLNAAEIVSLAKGFKPTRIRPQSLVFYAPLVRNLQDVRAGLALTNNNTATVADHPRVY